MVFTILADAVRQFLLFGIQRIHMVVSKQLLDHEDGGDRGLQLVGDGGDEGGLATSGLWNSVICPFPCQRRPH